MPNPPRDYSRVYTAIADDPDMAEVYADDALLGRWLRMLLHADAIWPVSAPMPYRDPRVRRLIALGAIVERPGNRYSVRGLDAERERRSVASRTANAVRWESDRSPRRVPRRDETRRDEHGGVRTYENGRTEPPGSDRQPPVHDGRHGPSCIVCAPIIAAYESPPGADTSERSKRQRRGA